MKKVLLITGIVLVAIILAVALLISPIAKSYIEKNSPEMVGRQVTINRLSINIFTGGIKMSGFAMAAAPGNDYANFVELDSLSTRVKLLSMLRSQFIISKMHLSGLRVNVWQKGEHFNFDDILAKFPSDTTEKAEDESSWGIGIYDIQLRESRVAYRDMLVGSNFTMNDVSIDVPGVYFSDKFTDVGLQLKFEHGGELNTKMSYDIQTSQYKLNLKFKEYGISSILPYLRQQFNVGQIDGLLTTDVNVVGDMDHIMEFDVNGSAELRGLKLTNQNQLLLASADRIRTHIKEINLIKERYILDSLVAEGAGTLFQINADGKNNFSTLLKDVAAGEPSAKPATEVPALKFAVGVLAFDGASVQIADKSVKGGFNYDITNIKLNAVNFSNDGKNAVKISAVMNGSGTASVNWKGSVEDMNNQNISVRLNNVNLKPLTPYMMQYFAYPITKGALSFTSQNIIAGGMLKGTNHLEAFKVDVGKRQKQLKPEYKIPFKTVLYILKDKNDRIDMSLPVSGNINSPEFSYRKLIIKTILNLMTKVAVAPFNFMGNALGIGKGNDMQQLPFAASGRDFTLEQYATLTDIATMQKQHPELGLTFTQHVNYEQAISAISMRELKKNFYIHTNPSKAGVLETIDFEAIRNIEDKDPALIIFADSLMGAGNTDASIDVKAEKIYESTSQALLESSLQHLNTQLRAFMEREGVAAKNIIVVSPSVTQMKEYDKKTMYELSVGLPGESTAQSETENTNENNIVEND